MLTVVGDYGVLRGQQLQEHRGLLRRLGIQPRDHGEDDVEEWNRLLDFLHRQNVRVRLIDYREEKLEQVVRNVLPELLIVYRSDGMGLAFSMIQIHELRLSGFAPDGLPIALILSKRLHDQCRQDDLIQALTYHPEISAEVITDVDTAINTALPILLGQMAAKKGDR